MPATPPPATSELLNGPQVIVGAVLAGSALAADAIRTVARLLASRKTPADLPAPSEHAVARAAAATAAARTSVTQLRAAADAASRDTEALIADARASAAAVAAQASAARTQLSALRRSVSDAREKCRVRVAAAERARDASARLDAARKSLGDAERELGMARARKREVDARLKELRDERQRVRGTVEFNDVIMESFVRKADALRDQQRLQKEGAAISAKTLGGLCDEIEVAKAELTAMVGVAEARQRTEGRADDPGAVAGEVEAATAHLQVRIKRAELALRAAEEERLRKERAVEDVLKGAEKETGV